MASRYSSQPSAGGSGDEASRERLLLATLGAVPAACQPRLHGGPRPIIARNGNRRNADATLSVPRTSAAAACRHPSPTACCCRRQRHGTRLLSSVCRLRGRSPHLCRYLARCSSTERPHGDECDDPASLARMEECAGPKSDNARSPNEARAPSMVRLRRRHTKDNVAGANRLLSFA